MNNKRVIVTGGAGLIGSRLCERLIEQGCSVVCIDNMLGGSLDNLQKVINRPGFDLVKHNVLKSYHFDAEQIYHLAAPTSPSFFSSFPVETMRIILKGAMNTLDVAKRTGAKILLASSGDVYGFSKMPLQSEELWGNVNTMSGRSAVEEGMRAAESLFRAYNVEYGVKTKIARVFNTYGAPVAITDDRVVTRFIVNALQGSDLVIYGNGMQTRSFCYADDIVEGLLRLMNATSDSITTPVNLGSSYEISIKDLALKIIEITASRSKITHMSAINDNPRHKTPDISQARQLFDWEPITPLDQGLATTISYVDEQLKCEKLSHYSMSWAEMC